MGYETSETKLECGCVRYRRTHDFFMDDGEVWYNRCNRHYFANMTKEEYQVYYEKNKDRLNANRRQRYQENIETERARMKEYREKNYEKVREREREKEQSETYKVNKQKYMLEYNKRPDRKQIDNERSTIKISCGCGGRYTEKHKAKHLATKKHINWVQEEQKKENEKWVNIEPLF